MKELKIGSYTLPRRRVIVFTVALLLWGIGLIFKMAPKMVPTFGPKGTFFGTFFNTFFTLFFFIAAWALAGLPVLKNAFKALRNIRNKGLDENFLMSVATIGAFAIGEWAEAAGVMIFYMIGELIQEAAANQARSSIRALLALKPDKARVLETGTLEGGEEGNAWKEVPAADVNPGSFVLVRPGERIPLDGVIVEGEGLLDLSMLTGESRPVTCAPGGEVRSGTVSLNGLLRIKTTKSAGDSSAAKIIRLVESAREAKAKPERFITAFARWYTPMVVGGAVLLAVLPPLLVPGASFSGWIYRALILLVISCPCALVVSVPLGYFAGIGGMSRQGIMVKGAVHLDSLNRVKNVAFDKTGTLTRGKFAVIAVEPEPGVSRETLLETAAQAEKESNHPIARAILEYYPGPDRELGPRPPVVSAGSTTFRYTEIAGQGLEVHSGESRILAGSLRLLNSRGIKRDRQDGFSGTAGEDTGVYSPVYIARDNRYLGRILIGDTLKEGAAEAISRLKDMGLYTSMLTGDTQSAAVETGNRLGINAVKAELLPEDKFREVEKLAAAGITVFVGDGINDAPVLARSHVGIAMGGGADAAVEAADVIIMTDDPGRIPETIERARKTHRIVMGNVAFALGAKGIFIVLAGLGLANMWIALIADVGVALAAILNSGRALAGKTGDWHRSHPQIRTVNR